MDVNSDAVAAAFHDAGVRTLIHGHTHRPAVHALEVDGRPVRRIVLGDWYAQGSVLAWSPEGEAISAPEAGDAQSESGEAPKDSTAESAAS